jgi:hypothetical protein
MSDIAELFARDPLKLSDQDLLSIVERFRAARGQFNLGNKMAGTTKPPTAKQAKTAEVAAKLNFDLEL